MSEEAVSRISKLVGDFDDRVQAAGADAWDSQSPCEEWTARQVVEHVGNNLNSVAAGLTGTPPVVIDVAGDVAGQWTATRDRFLEAANSADLSIPLDGPFGPMPAEQLIGRLIATDVLVHTWDLARAVGADDRLDADAVAGAYSDLKPLDAMLRRPGLFGEKQPVPDGADEQTEMLAFLGRKV